MMAMRLPTGLLEGRALSESAWMTRMLSGARCKISATTVDTKVSCAWPEVEVAIKAVTVPLKGGSSGSEEPGEARLAAGADAPANGVGLGRDGPT